MSASLCALCSVELTNENYTREHIIPQSIGGRRKIGNFICINCNSNAGKTWDSELFKQLSALALYLDISRENSPVPPQTFDTTSSGKVILHSDGFMTISKPLYEETPNEKGVFVKLHARNKKEAQKYLKGIKRKYPTADTEKALSEAEERTQYIDGHLEFNLSIGGRIAGRSIVKTALALAYTKNINIEQSEIAKDYLLNENGEACFGYYYKSDLIRQRPENSVIHCVSIQGCPNTKLLLGYIEYFSTFRIIVCLSKNYCGDAFSETYGIDPVTGKELSLDVEMPFTQSDIISIYNGEYLPDGAIGEAASIVIALGQKRSIDRERERVIDTSIKEALELLKAQGLKEGDELSKEQVDIFSRYVAEKLSEFYLHIRRLYFLGH